MEQIVVKTEMEESGEILFFYVDDTNGEVEGVATIENVEQMGMQIQELPTDTGYMMENVDDPNPVEEPSEDTQDIKTETVADQTLKDRWTPEEINRILIFYVDNKENFLIGNTKKKHLWNICCNTMLSGKNPTSCEVKLRTMKRKYAQYLINQQKGIYMNFPYLDLCHKAFYDDSSVTSMIKDNTNQDEPILAKLPEALNKQEEPPIIIKSITLNNTKQIDNKVELMLNLYLKYKKQLQKPKDLWEQIAMEIGEEDGDYWHKRFLNYKHHYLKMLSKRLESGSESIQWPYMSLYDQIFEEDEQFKRKFYAYPNDVPLNSVLTNVPSIKQHDWNITEMTVLVKYYFDCYDEFQDPTIPDSYLWGEIGRLLDKKPDVCKAKFDEMREEHLGKYLQGDYDISLRVPVAILFDNIISKDAQSEMSKDNSGETNFWPEDELDEMVKYFYDNVVLFKDPICHFVCLASVAQKLNKSITNCSLQWKDLTSLYRSILEAKKEDPDMQIDWKYIDFFDRIFDYGMDTNLMLDLTEKPNEEPRPKSSEKIAVKKVKVELEKIPENTEPWSDEEEYDERGFTKNVKRTYTESKMFKILEFYQKNKDKFATTAQKKIYLWETLGKQIGTTGEDCARRFKHLKDVYISFIEKEIEKPEIPIVWPYYALCKKVFGYRALKAKLKNNKVNEDDDWAAKEIKMLIRHFGQNFHFILDNLDDCSVWKNIAKEIGKSEACCMVKFQELKKGYQKMKKMKVMDPNVDIRWKYYSLIDDIFRTKGQELALDHDLGLEDGEHEQMEVLYEEDDKTGIQEDEDYQCIIVIPEGEDINMENAQIIIQNSDLKTEETIKGEVQMESDNETKPTAKWNKQTKKRLLILYLNYVRTRSGNEINSKEMWNEISEKLNKTPLSCRKMFAKLKTNHKQFKNDANKKKTPYYTLLEKILAIKPKFSKIQKGLDGTKSFKDMPLQVDKVEKALRYYLMHIKEFNSPRFEKKYLWTDLANFVNEPVNKVYNKVNYLKHYYNIETDLVAGENTLFSELIIRIVTEEIALKSLAENDKVDLEDTTEYAWDDDEIEHLLTWYLDNLEKFKNPKYVRKYLWLDVSNILKKSPLACSKKMSEIRTLYRNLVKDNSEELNNWRFSNLCQKIYGTGKKEPIET